MPETSSALGTASSRPRTVLFSLFLRQPRLGLLHGGWLDLHQLQGSGTSLQAQMG